jgi:hypothetical protein
MNKSYQQNNIAFSPCFFRAVLAFITVVVTSVVATSAHAALYWTPWVSEENGGPPTYCRAWNEAAVGFGCSGSYCDNIRILCETLPFNATLDSRSVYWTDFFSEETSGEATDISHPSNHLVWYPNGNGENYKVCHWNRPNPGLLAGIKCKGRYCDDISLECIQPIKWKNGISYPVQVNNCNWSWWYSEEQGSVDFGYNRYITGVRCRGRYCDDKQFYVCSLVDPAP